MISYLFFEASKRLTPLSLETSKTGTAECAERLNPPHPGGVRDDLRELLRTPGRFTSPPPPQTPRIPPGSASAYHRATVGLPSGSHLVEFLALLASLWRSCGALWRLLGGFWALLERFLHQVSSKFAKFNAL